MKVRNGFVSNSSSSNFLIVGVRGSQKLAQLAKADKWEEGWGGYHTGNTLIFLGNDYDYENDKPSNFAPYYAGVEAEQDLKNGKTIPELRKEFIEKAKVLGVTFTEGEVDLYYGEISSEG